ncbi:MAG: hypothetical protein HYZ37_12705 [Candidatus Solibacter usitatus]|nr:hypothetical protein [Candidatus Solibacter usitatus]
MFFRREKTRTPSFEELLDHLRQQGFTVQNESSGGSRIIRGVCAASIQPGPPPHIGKSGVLLDDEIGQLCDGGYQKFWLAPSGRRAPSSADHLRAQHNFDEDLREALGLISMYNESLGTRNELHLYDRVKDRDHGVPKRSWER